MTQPPQSLPELRRQLEYLYVSANLIDAAEEGARDVRHALARLQQASTPSSNGTHLLTAFQAAQILDGKYRDLKFAKWIVRDSLKSGGQGEVFLALDTTLNRLDVLKVLKQNGDMHQTRFAHEVQVLAGSSHLGLPRVYHFAEESGRLFFVMEYIRGHDLSELNRQGPLLNSLDDALEWIYKLTDPLAYLHDHGVIHRDVKPTNIILTSDDRLVLVDLGIAKIRYATAVTRADDHLGTPEYMSQEQFDDPSTVTAASDIYSLGCTMYFLVHGKPPFSGNWDELKEAHKTQPAPRLGGGRIHVPEEIEAIFQNMLHKSPSQRIQTASQLRSLLQHLTNGPGPDHRGFLSTADDADSAGLAPFTTAVHTRRQIQHSIHHDLQLDDFCHQLTITIDSIRRNQRQGR